MERLKKILSVFPKTVSWVIWYPQEPGENKAQFNFKRIGIVVGALTLVFVVSALFMPDGAEYVGDFREVLPQEDQKKLMEVREKNMQRATETTQKYFSGSSDKRGTVAYAPQGQSSASPTDRNTSMVLSRPGVNIGSQLAAGLKFSVRLMDKLSVADQGVPVIAVVTRGVFNESGGGIEEGARLFGLAQFQGGAERAQIQFQSISDKSGIVREIKGVAIDQDGQAGVSGDVHSKAAKNVAGQFISRFVGAYAAGSMERDVQGNSKGGVQNGLMNAVSETAKDRTQSYADNLKKEAEWIEIAGGQEVTVILTAPFTFREPGVSQ